MLKSLAPNLMVEDVARSAAFYREALGFTAVATVPEAAPFDFMMLQRDGVVMMLQSRASLGTELPDMARQAVGGSVLFYVIVEGLDALYQEAKGRTELAVDLHETWYGKREFGVRDSDGYLLVFAEDK